MIDRRHSDLAPRVFNVALFIVALMTAATAPAAHAREMVSVDRGEINMRAGAGTRHEALWLLSRGYPLQVIGHRGNWLHVRDFERVQGWVYRPLTANKPRFVVKASFANIRSGPGTRYRVVGKAQYGVIVQPVDRRPGWVEVRADSGTQGWIARSLLWGW